MNTGDAIHLDVRDSRGAVLALVAAVVAALVFLFAPLLSLLLVAVFATLITGPKANWAFLISICTLFTTLNIGKELAGDFVNYVVLQDYVADMPFSVLFDRDLLSTITGSYRVSEIGFYAPMWVLSHLFSDQALVISVSATLGIYVLTFFALLRIGATEQWSRSLTLIVLFFAFFISINFVQTTHLLRQYLATSTIFFAFALHISGRSRLALIVALAGCAIHNATLILVFDVAVLAFLFRKRPRPGRRVGAAIFRSLASLILLGVSLAAVSFLEVQQISLDESPISVWHYVVVGGFFGVFLVFSAGGERQPAFVRHAKLAFIVIFTLSLGFFVLGMRVFALRYLAYLEWLFPLMLGGILHAMPRAGVGRYFFARAAILGAGLVIFLARVQGAPWSYGGLQADIFAQSFGNLLQGLFL